MTDIKAAIERIYTDGACSGNPGPGGWGTVVYFTDGEETPKLHAFNTRDLAGFQGAKDWLFVGVGDEKGTAIPKLDENNQVIGYWSNESFAMQPGIAQISESNIGTRNDYVAGGTNDRFLSKLDEEYLKTMTKEIGAKYVNGDSLQAVLSAMKSQPAARKDSARFELKWILAGLAGLLFLTAYFPKHPLQEITSLLSQYTRRTNKPIKI